MTATEAALLVVDDNEDNRYTLTRRLNSEGYKNLTMSSNGLQALDKLKAQPFDLVHGARLAIPEFPVVSVLWTWCRSTRWIHSDLWRKRTKLAARLRSCERLQWGSWTRR